MSGRRFRPDGLDLEALYALSAKIGCGGGQCHRVWARDSSITAASLVFGTSVIAYANFFIWANVMSKREARFRNWSWSDISAYQHRSGSQTPNPRKDCVSLTERAGLVQFGAIPTRCERQCRPFSDWAAYEPNSNIRAADKAIAPISPSDTNRVRLRDNLYFPSWCPGRFDANSGRGPVRSNLVTCR